MTARVIAVSIGLVLAAAPLVAQDSMPHRTDTLMVTGPALLALFPTTQAEVDADTVEGHLQEGLADFQYYFHKAATELAFQRIQGRDFYSDTIILNWPTHHTARFGVQDSIGVLYLVVDRTGVLDSLTQGVASDMQLICVTLKALKHDTKRYDFCST